MTTSDMTGIPLTPGIARPLVLHLFGERRQWARPDLAAAVEQRHLSMGGVRGTQPTSRVLKKALHDLVEEGAVENVGHRIWRRTGDMESDLGTSNGQEAGQVSELEDEGDEEDLTVLERLGDGDECVYLYYNPNDRELAQFKGKDTWECKIGCTRSGASLRIIGQGARTALSHEPVIGLLINTSNAPALERALHSSLRLMDCEVVDAPGSEWFLTSPDRIKAWFASYQASLRVLSPNRSA